MIYFILIVILFLWHLVSFKKSVILRDGNKYLIRYTLLKFFGLFSVKLHKIHQSDPSDLHDHPWPYISIILSGGYFEERKESKIWYKPGSILFRKANIPHRLIITDIVTTLVITGPKFRRWGFVSKDGEWKDHSEIEY
jgi:hypothetical protein